MNPKNRNFFVLPIVSCAIMVCLLNNVWGQAAHLSGEAAAAATPADTSFSGRMNALSPEQLLRGRVSGVRVFETDGNPMGALITTIRGTNSLRGNSDPLWIVDGVILNPSQLEVDPLFWQDNFQKKDYTSVQNTLATINPDDIETIKVLKDVAATAIYGSKGGNGVIIITTRQAKQMERRISWTSGVSLATSEEGDEMLELSTYKNFQQLLGNNLSAFSNPVNWTEKALKGRTALSYNHNLTVSGTENKMNYYISGFYNQIEGIIEGNGSKLGGLRANIDMNASKIFTFGTRIGFAVADISMSKGANPLGELSTVTAIKTGVPDLNALNSFASWQTDYDDNSREYRVNPAIYFTLNPVEGLKFITNFGADFRGKDRSSWLGKGTPLGNENNGAASLSSLTALSYNLNSVLTYNISDENHNYSFSSGAEILNRYNSFNTMNGTDFFSHELRAKGINLGSSKAQIHQYYVRSNQTGFFATMAYDYDGKYGLNGIIRLDKMNKQEDGFNLYPALSGWLKLKEQNGNDNTGYLSSLTLRSGWGKAGNSLVAPYDHLARYYHGPESFIKPELAPFYKMFWQTISNEFTAGFEVGFLNERIVVAATYYDKLTDDRIVLNCFGEEYGKNGYWRYTDRSTALKKEGSISNKGFELEMKSKIISKKNLSWNLDFNGTTNKNRVEKVEGSITGGFIGSGIYANFNDVGKPVGALYGYRVAGIVTPENHAKAPTFNGKPLKVGDMLFRDNTSNGDVNASDKEVIGNPAPRFFGGFISDLSIGRFLLGIVVDGAYGHDILNLDRMMQENVSGTGNITTEAFANAYNFTNKAEYPSVKATGTGEISNRFIEKGNFTRLAEIKAEYDFPVQKIEWVKSLKLSLCVYNALTFSSGKRWNPESNSYGFDNSRQGIAYGMYPESRYFTLGVNATF